MKNQILIQCLMAGLIFLSADCRKEGENCHKTITIYNKSSESIKLFRTHNDAQNPGYCVFLKYGEIIHPNGKYEDYSFNCWESRLVGENYKVFIVPASSTNIQSTYPCDSLNQYNTVIATYDYSIEDLKVLNFNIIHN